MKIVVLDGFLVNYDKLGWQLDTLFDVVWYDFTDDAEIVPRIGDADAIFINRQQITAQIIAACPALSYIGIFGTGYNTIDLDAASKAGITICNVPAYSTDAVAQCLFSLLLNICSQTYRYNDYVHSGKWVSCTDQGLVDKPIFELSGKTLGIIGYGAIGAAVARIATAFGMKILAYRRHPDRSLESPLFKFVPLDELLPHADIISVHCPLNPQTQGMINKETIAQMKGGVVLLNTARGGVLNEQDVANALDSGKIYMLGADVLSAEPPEADHPLARHPRAVISPHIAWMPVETRRRCLDLAQANLLAYLEGSPQNVVVCY